MNTFDYADNVFWSQMATSEVTALEGVVHEIKTDLQAIEEARIMRRAEWDEYAAVQHEPEAYRQRLAEYSRWRADIYLRHKAVKARQSQMIAAMRDQVGLGRGPTARTLIHRLAKTVLRYEVDPDMDKKELFAILDNAYLVARGKQMTLREFVEAGSLW